jgi:hypothetical protein
MNIISENYFDYLWCMYHFHEAYENIAIGLVILKFFLGLPPLFSRGGNQPNTSFTHSSDKYVTHQLF